MGLDNYHVIEPIGEGSFGKVYKGRRKFTGQIVAMKFILKHGKSEKDIRNLRQVRCVWGWSFDNFDALRLCYRSFFHLDQVSCYSHSHGDHYNCSRSASS